MTAEVISGHDKAEAASLGDSGQAGMTDAVRQGHDNAGAASLGDNLLRWSALLSFLLFLLYPVGRFSQMISGQNMGCELIIKATKKSGGDLCNR